MALEFSYLQIVKRWTSVTCALLLVLNLSAQFNIKQTKRALIIGISNYEDDVIPDLQFANRDAEAMADYFLNVDPVKIRPEHIKLITDEQATGGNVHKALNELLEETKPNDQVIIYFSGHGDVETIDDLDPGHLLLYDTPSSTYKINSLRLSDLRDIVKQLSVDIGAEVTLITDACRSGNLAGKVINGSQATAAGLIAQFANETKILSCQPDEFSIEGPQWGGGRGVFSYHLVEGLTGLADNNKNFQVSLRELQRYLEDRVEEDVSPSNQSPIVQGNRNKVISTVSEENLISLIESKTQDTHVNLDVLSSIYESKASSVNSEVATITNLFYSSLNSKKYVSSDIAEADSDLAFLSADILYDSLVNLNLPEAKLRGIKGDFIAALQDDSQKAINDYLRSDNKTLDDRKLGRGSKYRNFPAYLERPPNSWDRDIIYMVNFGLKVCISVR